MQKDDKSKGPTVMRSVVNRLQTGNSSSAVKRMRCTTDQEEVLTRPPPLANSAGSTGADYNSRDASSSVSSLDEC